MNTDETACPDPSANETGANGFVSSIRQGP
jgi:hypothetical protein